MAIMMNCISVHTKSDNCKGSFNDNYIRINTNNDNYISVNTKNDICKYSYNKNCISVHTKCSIYKNSYHSLCEHYNTVPIIAIKIK